LFIKNETGRGQKGLTTVYGFNLLKANLTGNKAKTARISRFLAKENRRQKFLADEIIHASLAPIKSSGMCPFTGVIAPLLRSAAEVIHPNGQSLPEVKEQSLLYHSPVEPPRESGGYRMPFLNFCFCIQGWHKE
jgi:hypothetical protein